MEGGSTRNSNARRPQRSSERARQPVAGLEHRDFGRARGAWQWQLSLRRSERREGVGCRPCTHGRRVPVAERLEGAERTLVGPEWHVGSQGVSDTREGRPTGRKPDWSCRATITVGRDCERAVVVVCCCLLVWAAHTDAGEREGRRGGHVAPPAPGERKTVERCSTHAPC